MSNSNLKSKIADLEQKYSELSNTVTSIKLDVISTKQHVGIVSDVPGESEPQQPMLRQESKDMHMVRGCLSIIVSLLVLLPSDSLLGKYCSRINAFIRKRANLSHHESSGIDVLDLYIFV